MHVECFYFIFCLWTSFYIFSSLHSVWSFSFVSSLTHGLSLPLGLSPSAAPEHGISVIFFMFESRVCFLFLFRSAQFLQSLDLPYFRSFIPLKIINPIYTLLTPAGFACLLSPSLTEAHVFICVLNLIWAPWSLSLRIFLRPVFIEIFCETVALLLPRASVH